MSSVNWEQKRSHFFSMHRWRRGLFLLFPFTRRYHEFVFSSCQKNLTQAFLLWPEHRGADFEHGYASWANYKNNQIVFSWSNEWDHEQLKESCERWTVWITNLRKCDLPWSSSRRATRINFCCFAEQTPCFPSVSHHFWDHEQRRERRPIRTKRNGWFRTRISCTAVEVRAPSWCCQGNNRCWTLGHQLSCIWSTHKKKCEKTRAPTHFVSWHRVLRKEDGKESWSTRLRSWQAESASAPFVAKFWGTGQMRLVSVEQQNTQQFNWIDTPILVRKTKQCLKHSCVKRTWPRYWWIIKESKQWTPPECVKNSCNRSLLLLTVHSRIHSGEKPYKCVTCNHEFTTKPNLRRHELSHKGVRNFQCLQCLKWFTEKKTLKLHTLTHTGERPYK